MGGEEFEALLVRLSQQPFPIAQVIDAATKLQAVGQIDRAVLLYRMWAKFNPNDPFLYVIYFNLGTTLSNRGDLAGAKDAFEEAIKLKPDFFPPYINLGGVWERAGKTDEAIKTWLGVVNQLEAITGNGLNFKTMAIKQIGRVLEGNQKHAEAELILRQGLSLDQNQLDVAQHYLALRMVQCEWPIVQPWEGVSRKALMKGFSPLSIAAYTDDPILHLGVSAAYNRTIEDPPADTEYLWQQVERRPSDRLRIGYLSSDLRHHAIGFLTAEVFELHDRSKVEVFAYYCGIPPEDNIKTRIRNAVEHWVDISGMDDQTAAKRIAEDNIDILVDVNGYTRDARTRVLAFRPAPIIVNWLGFPGTMASPYHHYILADDWIIPKESEIYYTEKVLRLPCYQPNDRKRLIAPETPTRASVGLPEDAIVYCSFNGSQKITRFTFDRWMTILEKVPNSVLWQLSASENLNERLRTLAAERGIDPNRLIFAPKIANPAHLARYPLADLFLDSFPYGAHTTASDALWMGVPVLTFSGRSFASRVCGSLVRAANLPELVCDGPEDFVKRAIALGHDRETLRRYREKLVQNRDKCVLFDMDGHVRALEGLFQQMWQEFQDGNLPQPDLTNLDIYHEVAIEEDHETREMLSIEDYNDFYREKLARRHKFRPIPEDKRLWTQPASKTATTKGIRPKKRAV
jgi:predicted O-linked N-acetylglucosamine transferase (SPINDLY family)